MFGGTVFRVFKAGRRASTKGKWMVKKESVHWNSLISLEPVFSNVGFRFVFNIYGFERRVKNKMTPVVKVLLFTFVNLKFQVFENNFTFLI